MNDTFDIHEPIDWDAVLAEVCATTDGTTDIMKKFAEAALKAAEDYMYGSHSKRSSLLRHVDSGGEWKLFMVDADGRTHFLGRIVGEIQ